VYHGFCGTQILVLKLLPTWPRFLVKHMERFIHDGIPCSQEI